MKELILANRHYHYFWRSNVFVFMPTVPLKTHLNCIFDEIEIILQPLHHIVQRARNVQPRAECFLYLRNYCRHNDKDNRVVRPVLIRYLDREQSGQDFVNSNVDYTPLQCPFMKQETHLLSLLLGNTLIKPLRKILLYLI